MRELHGSKDRTELGFNRNRAKLSRAANLGAQEKTEPTQTHGKNHEAGTPDALLALARPIEK
jgi:hypothetical protein